MKNKKKVNAKAAQKEVERELSEDSLGQVAGGVRTRRTGIQYIPEQRQGIVVGPYEGLIKLDGERPHAKLPVARGRR